MSKLSFRARALDAGKPMPICMAEELPELPDYSVIHRAVPQMPSGMEEEEECEHHLQRAICAGLIIPTPEVSDIADKSVHDMLYPANYKQPRELIHMQPFTMEQDIPDYDMDSEDERWLDSQAKRIDLKPLKFEEMMDRLEKSSGQTVVSLAEAQALLKEDDDLIIAVFDYWLNKRLKLQHPLLLAVKTEHRAGTAVNNPYIAFRRRTEKMQTRKNRKNDETSYEKMLKLRRDLSRAVSLLEFIKKREKTKRELMQLTVDVYEKRFHAKDFSGAIAAEFAAQKASRPAFTPIFQNNYTNHAWNNKSGIKEEQLQRGQKRPYKKRKHKSSQLGHQRLPTHADGAGGVSSEDELVAPPSPEPEEPEDEGPFAFRRLKNCSYHMPLPHQGNWPWCSQDEHGGGDHRYRYTLTSLNHPRTCVGFARRRMGRGGRVILDRLSADVNDFWRMMDYTVYDSTDAVTEAAACARTEIKVEPQEDSLPAAARTSVSEVCDVSLSTATTVSEGVKQESSDDLIFDSQPSTVQQPPPPLRTKHLTKEDHDEMLEILQSVRRDWLHFRPKTPPPDWSPPCDMLPADEAFAPSANTPFSLELRTLDDSDLFTEQSFVSAPLLLDYDLLPEVPVTDTRQASSTHSPPPNTLISTRRDDDHVVGCSRFSVSDGTAHGTVSKKSDRLLCTVSSTSTFASPKLLNSVAATPASPAAARAAIAAASGVLANSTATGYDAPTTIGNANGIVTSLIEGGNRTRMSKYETFNHPYARPPVGNNLSGGGNSAFRGLHTSIPLNSHSANILEIPMSGDAVADAVSAKGQCDADGSSPSNKAAAANKSIVRKSLVMEVT
ncbi:enhancer of polycomb homolog 1 [Atheta coriaria]|uniref:enhancer of polycomb homolog 1 n=1 Tax=Dalotia coriaria TaxID=877792 RepID=UPI0031F36046